MLIVHAVCATRYQISCYFHKSKMCIYHAYYIGVHIPIYICRLFYKKVYVSLVSGVDETEVQQRKRRKHKK